MLFYPAHALFKTQPYKNKKILHGRFENRFQCAKAFKAFTM